MSEICRSIACCLIFLLSFANVPVVKWHISSWSTIKIISWNVWKPYIRVKSWVNILEKTCIIHNIEELLTGGLSILYCAWGLSKNAIAWLKLVSKAILGNPKSGIS